MALEVSPGVSPDTIELLTFTLKNVGYQVESSSSGQESISQNRNLDLTKTEFKLLAMLIKNRDRVLTREKLLEDVWGYDAESCTLELLIRMYED